MHWSYGIHIIPLKRGIMLFCWWIEITYRVILFQEVCSSLLCFTSNFSNHNNTCKTQFWWRKQDQYSNKTKCIHTSNSMIHMASATNDKTDLSDPMTKVNRLKSFIIVLKKERNWFSNLSSTDHLFLDLWGRRLNSRWNWSHWTGLLQYQHRETVQGLPG